MSDSYDDYDYLAELDAGELDNELAMLGEDFLDECMDDEYMDNDDDLSKY